jgi:hypothetical protein
MISCVLLTYLTTAGQLRTQLHGRGKGHGTATTWSISSDKENRTWRTIGRLLTLPPRRIKFSKFCLRLMGQSKSHGYRADRDSQLPQTLL